MNKLALLILMTSAFIFSSGFFKKNEDGSYSADTAAIEKKADEVAASTEAGMNKAAAESEKALEKLKTKWEAAKAKYNVSEEDVITDLSKSADEMKTKVSEMDTAKIMAYLSKYKDVFESTQANIADYSQQVKDLKWTEKWGKKGKELKAELSKYNEQFKGLTAKAQVYYDQLKAKGVNLADHGIDLSAYGLK